MKNRFVRSMPRHCNSFDSLQAFRNWLTLKNGSSGLLCCMFMALSFYSTAASTHITSKATSSITPVSENPQGGIREQDDLKNEFLQLCDLSVQQINNYATLNPVARQKGMHFYIESYMVRALAVAYDMTGKEAYLEACRTWSDRLITTQEKMIPAGFYYMNYNRKPFEVSGDCYNGDNGSIAMAVLATAVRCKNAQEKKRYLNSVESYADLVLNNYVGQEGGITDGIWHMYDGQWWCSTGTVGSLFFLLYKETHKPVYLQSGLKAIDWLNHQDLDTVGPFPLAMQGPSLPMYTFEAYSAGLPYIQQNPRLYSSAKKQISWFSNWAAGYKFEDGQWGSKFGGIPFQLMIQGKAAQNQQMLQLAESDMKQIRATIFGNGNPRLSQFVAFAMMSMAEKLSPGTIYRPSELFSEK